MRDASWRSIGVSVILHSACLLLLLGLWSNSAGVVSPMRLPGTASGTQRLLVFSMGGAPPQPKTALRAKTTPVDAAVPRPHTATKTTPTVSTADTSSPGVGISGESALGDGNISIALVKFHPRPTPDLSSLPHGTTGDVVLDAVIDAQGKIANLKISKGFGGAIDQTVIATVQQWTFIPAMKDGVPVASEQEILFHYEHA